MLNASSIIFKISQIGSFFYLVIMKYIFENVTRFVKKYTQFVNPGFSSLCNFSQSPPSTQNMAYLKRKLIFVLITKIKNCFVIKLLHLVY